MVLGGDAWGNSCKKSQVDMLFGLAQPGSVGGRLHSNDGTLSISAETSGKKKSRKKKKSY
jgi:hypothetical protein